MHFGQAMISAAKREPVEKLPTAIPSLDALLGGGLVRGSTSLIVGAPGTGKTVLGNQLAFNHVARRGRALFVAQQGETHDRMLLNLRNMSFFDPDVVGRELWFLNGLTSLESRGVEGLRDMIAHAVEAHRATLLVVDGLLSAELVADSTHTFKSFVQKLQSHTSMMDCTTVLLSTDAPGYGDATGPAHIVVDGLIKLNAQRHGLRVSLEMEIAKFRGSRHLLGRHAYEIDERGVAVYPRIETVAGLVAPMTPTPTERLSSGIAELDTMAGGGFMRGSTTIVLGAAGSAKTLLGMQFLLEGASKNERGVLVGFYEPPPQLCHVAAAAGLDLDEHVRRGTIELAWHPRREQLVDKVAGDLLAVVERTGAKRLFVDSLGGFAYAALHPERMSDFFAAIANELRAREITTLWSDETAEPIGPDVHTSVANVSAISENIVLLRCIDTPTGLHRIISLRKVRGSTFDSSLHELWVTSDGVRVAPSCESARALLESKGFKSSNIPEQASEVPRSKGGAR